MVTSECTPIVTLLPVTNNIVHLTQNVNSSISQTIVIYISNNSLYMHIIVEYLNIRIWQLITTYCLVEYAITTRSGKLPYPTYMLPCCTDHLCNQPDAMTSQCHLSQSSTFHSIHYAITMLVHGYATNYFLQLITQNDQVQLNLKPDSLSELKQPQVFNAHDLHSCRFHLDAGRWSSTESYLSITHL